MGERLVILDPTAGPQPSQVTPAPRLDNLERKVLGLVDNTKLNSDRFIFHLQDVLRRDHPSLEFVVRRKAGASSVASGDILDDLAERCDAVVAAVGD